MAAFVKIMGWIAFAVGLIFIVIPLAAPDLVSFETAVSPGVFMLVTGPLLVGVSQLIEVAEKIQANTNWFSTGAPPAAQPAQGEGEAETSEPTEAASEHKAEAPPPPDEEATPVPQPQPQERPAPRSERRPQRPAPQLYDANRHPAAVDEWSHNGRRVMTLEDGTLATEVDGAWYRFLRLEDIDAARQ